MSHKVRGDGVVGWWGGGAGAGGMLFAILWRNAYKNRFVSHPLQTLLIIVLEEFSFSRS